MALRSMDRFPARPSPLVALVALLGIAGLASACTDDGGTQTFGDRDTTEADTVGDIDETESPDTADPDTVEVETDGATLAVNACTGDGDCSGGARCVGTDDGRPGVCLRQPGAAQAIKLWRETETWKDTDGKGKWNKEYEGCTIQGNSASCFATTDFEEPAVPPSPPTLTNVLGFIKVFGLDTPCQGVYVDLFTERDDMGNVADVNCSSNPQRPDGTPDCQGHSAWVAGGAVFKKEHTRDGHAYDRCYVFLTGVPTGRRLVSRASPLTPSAQVRNTYQYNLFIKPSDARTADKDGFKDGFRMEMTVISDSSYQLIPTTAGLSGGIEEDRGALAGTLRDCLGLRAQGGTVAMTGDTFKLAYFNANPNNLLPAVTQQFTNKDGSFASVNHEEGLWRLVGAMYHEGAVHVFKARDVRVYRGSVTIYGFRGNAVSSYPEAVEDTIRCRPKAADASQWECEEDLPHDVNICQ